MLGNPVSVVRGVVIGAKDLFYEPFKVKESEGRERGGGEREEYLLFIYAPMI